MGTELSSRGEAQHNALSDGLNGLSNNLGDQIVAVRSSLTGTADALESLRKGDISSLSKDIASLEQKVAKWVHAHPLPAKVGEARLYSLEARLKEEMDARMELEIMIKDQSNHNNSKLSTALPQLPSPV